MFITSSLFVEHIMFNVCVFVLRNMNRLSIKIYKIPKTFYAD